MSTQHQLVSIYLNEADQWEHRPLYLEILGFLSRSGCAGGTVLRGLAGFTAGVEMEAASSPGSEGKLPVVLQLIEVPTKIAEVLPTLRKMVGRRLITVQEAQVVHS
jgi:PII-like signaling protein